MKTAKISLLLLLLQQIKNSNSLTLLQILNDWWFLNDKNNSFFI